VFASTPKVVWNGLLELSLWFWSGAAANFQELHDWDVPELVRKDAA
jgi:hypothetical protein